MKHTTKSNIFKALSLLPDKVGFFLYHKMQSVFDTSNLESKTKKCEVTYNKLTKICEELHIDLSQKTILEIGSGWLPIMPYFFKYLAGVKSIFTYDINKHYQKNAITDFNNYFSNTYNCDIIPKKVSKFNLPEGIKYFPSKNISNEKLPEVDLIFSRYVLSHASENDVVLMHQKFKKNFPKGTFIIHFISPSDLRQHSDSSISLQDFLQFSKEEWNKIQTKFDSHNRLRLPQFIEIFETIGYEIVYKSFESVVENSKNQEMFRKIKLHSDYQKYTEAELTAGNIVLVLKIK